MTVLQHLSSCLLHKCCLPLRLINLLFQSLRTSFYYEDAELHSDYFYTRSRRIALLLVLIPPPPYSSSDDYQSLEVLFRLVEGSHTKVT